MKLGKFMFIVFFLTSNVLFSPNTNTKAEAAGSSDNGGIPVLLYHQILKKSENQFTSNSNVINLEAFEVQMKYLYDQGYYTATLPELDSYLRGKTALPAKTVVITFDDGFKTNYLYAYPVLKKYRFKAASFLITNRISEAPVPFHASEFQNISWPEINQMRDVFLFGSHTHGLHNLYNGTAALLVESDDVILHDLDTSRNLLNTHFFAYPFGAYNKHTIELLKLSGFQYAFTTAAVNVTIRTSPFELGRKPVLPTTTLTKFKEMISGGTSKAGWTISGSIWYYLDENGAKITGWLKLGSSWYYFDQSGVMKTGWVKYGAAWYYLAGSGEMKTGWVKSGSQWYYLNQNGSMRTGWLKDNGVWYFLESGGAMKTGWLLNGGAWYYLDPSGAMKTGWCLSASKWYYMDETGAMKRGWLDAAEEKYYLKNDGSMAAGWMEIENNWYYFYQNGLMARNTTIDGYPIGEDGVRGAFGGA